MTETRATVDPVALVASVIYKPGWTFKIGGPDRRFLCVFATTPDSFHPERQRTTQHMFEIPAVTDVRAFLRWVRDCLLLAEQHECCEFIQFRGSRPFFPHHQDEGSPYDLIERWEP
jgi:hypothetical protein